MQTVREWHHFYEPRSLRSSWEPLGSLGLPDHCHMLPRCIPDASQMPPRCLSDASQMPLRCLSNASQMPPRCLPDASQMPPRCLLDALTWDKTKSLTNQVQKKDLELFSTSLCAEFRYGSDGESHLGWGPYTSSVFDEKHTTVFVHVFVCIRYASVYIRMRPYTSLSLSNTS